LSNVSASMLQQPETIDKQRINEKVHQSCSYH
jgi:hypothetical protein